MEARHWFDTSLPLFKKLFLELTSTAQDNIGQELTCLGYIAREKSQILRAKGYFLDALRIAIDGDFFLTLTHTLPGIALLFVDQGQVERAVELYALAATQGIVANSKWFDDIAGDEIARAAAGLPAEVG